MVGKEQKFTYSNTYANPVDKKMYAFGGPTFRRLVDFAFENELWIERHIDKSDKLTLCYGMREIYSSKPFRCTQDGEEGAAQTVLDALGKQIKLGKNESKSLISEESPADCSAEQDSRNDISNPPENIGEKTWGTRPKQIAGHKVAGCKEPEDAKFNTPEGSDTRDHKPQGAEKHRKDSDKEDEEKSRKKLKKD
ncbi:hypothetical protein SCHPADRAFT_894855 [Schizopora paradoxa]|uniref:Uncharacterized protein n=1 Tax=Schizopora paradoxa TaxID=27342 RepID=A0A0H2RCG9_9AGAM|nr:hypothetical protein SCHPADRAFT_894855 [Schizopora paradoxa]